MSMFRTAENVSISTFAFRIFERVQKFISSLTFGVTAFEWPLMKASAALATVHHCDEQVVTQTEYVHVCAHTLQCTALQTHATHILALLLRFALVGQQHNFAVFQPLCTNSCILGHPSDSAPFLCTQGATLNKLALATATDPSCTLNPFLGW